MTATTAERQENETTAPMRPRGSVSRVVAADAERLYHWVADITRTPEWSPETRECVWADGAAGRPGDRFRGTNRAGMLRWTRECEVVAAEPGREFAFRTIPDEKADDSTVWTFRFEPVEGGTRVTHAYEIVKELPPRLQRLAALLIPAHRDRRPDMARSLERLADIVEGLADVPQAELGQTHTAEGPLPLSTMYAMHHAFRRDLRDLARAVPATPVDDAAAWAALARRWDGFARSLHHHHTIEDEQIWPRVLDRADAAGDTGARRTLAAVEAEHGLIDPLLEACGAGFGTMASAPDEAARARLAADVAAFRDLLADHLAHEEGEALPLVQRYVSSAAWRESEKAAEKEFGRSDLAFALPWAAFELPREQFRLVFAEGGPMIRLLLALTRPRFTRAHRTAFRHI